MGDAILAGPQAQEQLPVACDDIDGSILRLIDEWPARRQNSTMSTDDGELCWMGDAILAGPRAQEQLPVACDDIDESILRLIDEWTARRQNSTVSTDDGLAWMPRQQVQSFSDAVDSGTSSSQRNKRRHEEVESDVAPRQFKFPRQNTTHVSSMSKDDGLAIIDAWVARHSDEDPGSRNADCQGQTPSAMGVWHDGALNIAPQHEIIPGRSISQGKQELDCRAAVAEPGSPTPGVAVNGEALRINLCKLPSANQNATASGSHPWKVLPKVSAGTNLMVTRQGGVPYMLWDI